MELEIIQNLLERELSLNPEELKRQLVQIEGWHSRIIDMKLDTEDKTLKSRMVGYQKVLEKRLSLGQSLLRTAQEELKRSI